MKQKTVDGVLVSKTDREDCDSLKVGDMVPDVFGGMSTVVSIFGRGIDILGRAYVCFYAKTASGLTCSHSMGENEIVSTIPLIRFESL